MAAEEGFRWWEANTRVNLAELALARDRPEDAAEHAGRAVRLSRPIGDRQATVYALACLACVAAENGDADRAGRLCGAIDAEAARRPVGGWEVSAERDQYAARLQAISSTEFESGVREGRKLSLPAAVDEALADRNP